MFQFSFNFCFTFSSCKCVEFDQAEVAESDAAIDAAASDDARAETICAVEQKSTRFEALLAWMNGPAKVFTFFTIMIPYLCPIFSLNLRTVQVLPTSGKGMREKTATSKRAALEADLDEDSGDGDDGPDGAPPDGAPPASRKPAKKLPPAKKRDPKPAARPIVQLLQQQQKKPAAPMAVAN